MPEYYDDTYYAKANRAATKDVLGWIGARCERVPTANYAIREVYEAYCQDAGRLPWPSAGAVSLSLFSRALGRAGIERRKASVTRVIGLRPLRLMELGCMPVQ